MTVPNPCVRVRHADSLPAYCDTRYNAFLPRGREFWIRTPSRTPTRALTAGGAFVFGTRHLQARAWETWNPANAGILTLTLPDGREIRGWHRWTRTAAKSSPWRVPNKMLIAVPETTVES